jgi:hypothetical protein
LAAVYTSLKVYYVVDIRVLNMPEWLTLLRIN